MIASLPASPFNRTKRGIETCQHVDCQGVSRAFLASLIEPNVELKRFIRGENVNLLPRLIEPNVELKRTERFCLPYHLSLAGLIEPNVELKPQRPVIPLIRLQAFNRTKRGIET